MKIVELNKTGLIPNMTATIGIFDGLHKGHKKLLDHVLQNSPNAVITFYRHPRGIKTLLSLSQRLRKFKELGINRAIIFSSKDNILGMTANDFIYSVIKKLNINHLIIGSDFRMGNNRGSGIDDIKTLCEKNNIKLTAVEIIYNDGKKLSSTDIRSFVEHGNLPKAAFMLGHNIELNGVVVKGKGNGAKIGFRTANIKLNPLRTAPEQGVYVTRTRLGQSHDDKTTWYDSVTFIGESPTIHNITEQKQVPLVETHIIGFNKKIYGAKICIELIEKLRDIKKFPDLTALSKAIDEDIKLAVKKLHSYK